MIGIPKVNEIEKKLMDMQERKDKVLEISRELIRTAGRAITLIHARELDKAGSSMKTLVALEKKLRGAEKGFEYFSVQAHQEYVEAMAFYTVFKEQRLVSASEVGVDEVPYLLGMMDLVGELKREIIESMRAERLDDANAYYGFMKGIYDSTRSMRFASSLVPDFRHKQDTARIQLENAGSELLSYEAKRR